MTKALSTILPFLSVLLGAAITYYLNVRTRHRTKAEDTFHDAIAAVATAYTAHDFITYVPGANESAERVRELNEQGQRDAHLNYARAEAEARAALARASAYDATLLRYLEDRKNDVKYIYNNGPEIMASLRASIHKSR